MLVSTWMLLFLSMTRLAALASTSRLSSSVRKVTLMGGQPPTWMCGHFRNAFYFIIFEIFISLQEKTLSGIWRSLFDSWKTKSVKSDRKIAPSTLAFAVDNWQLFEKFLATRHTSSCKELLLFKMSVFEVQSLFWSDLQFKVPLRWPSKRKNRQNWKGTTTNFLFFAY